MLLAANGSHYVIEFIISQYLSITRSQKYFFIFFISYGLCAVACTKVVGGQVLLAANGSSYTTDFIIWWYFSMTRIQICFWNFSIFYGFCGVVDTKFFPPVSGKKNNEKKQKKNKTRPKNEKFGKFAETRPKKMWARYDNKKFFLSKTRFPAGKNSKSRTEVRDLTRWQRPSSWSHCNHELQPT